MKRSSIFRMFLFCLVLVIGFGVVQAQTEPAESGNLLTNPGFEQPFVAVADAPTSMVAQGWTAWSLETDQNQQPEYYPASDTTNGMSTPRIHSGSDAQQYFSFFAGHDAGVYQTVSGVAAGDQLTFSIYAYLWDSSGDNPDVSDGSGNLAMQVGIDPTGGSDPTSSAIVWSSPLSLVDQFAEHSVTATAEGDTVTVFVRSTVTKVAMNNVVYLDDASLTVTGEAAPVIATEEATTEVTEAATVAETQAVVVTSEVTAEVPTAEMTTEVPTSEVTAEVTAEAPTEVPTDTPTEAPPTATFTPAPPTDTPTPEPPTNTPTEAPPTNPPTPSPTLDTTAFPYLLSYTVVRGDTVGRLAARFGSTVDAIIIANHLSPDARIFETQQLIIPVSTLPQPATPTLPPTPTEAPPTTTETPVVVQALPTFTETPVVVQPLAPPQATAQTTITYVVRYGDTLSTIAVRFGIATRDLARANGIINPNLIYIGQVLRIPVAGTPTPVAPTATSTPTQASAASSSAQPQMYTVQPGDNLYRISVRFNVPIVALIEANGIYDASRIFVGQTLVIP